MAAVARHAAATPWRGTSVGVEVVLVVVGNGVRFGLGVGFGQ
jgi:hypothetical protein